MLVNFLRHVCGQCDKCIIFWRNNIYYNNLFQCKLTRQSRWWLKSKEKMGHAFSSGNRTRLLLNNRSFRTQRTKTMIHDVCHPVSRECKMYILPDLFTESCGRISPCKWLYHRQACVSSGSRTALLVISCYVSSTTFLANEYSYWISIHKNAIAFSSRK